MFHRKRWRGLCAPDVYRAWSFAYATPQHSVPDTGARRCESRSHWHGKGAFGVRRPLRYLSYELGLDEHQVREVARILSNLKTERAQADVDERRTLSRIADSMGAPDFDPELAEEGLGHRVESARRMSAEVLKALQQLHGVLDVNQRHKMADLLRSGVISL